MFGYAFLDLARLLVGVDVEDEVAADGVAADHLEPVARAGADGVRGEADANALPRELLDLAQILGGRALAKAVEPAATVGGVEEDELDPGGLPGFRGREGLLEPEVVELADGRPAARQHLAVDRVVSLAHFVRGLAARKLEHRVAPAPEVAAARRPAQGALERVAVSVDKSRQAEAAGHAAITIARDGDQRCSGPPRAAPERADAGETGHDPALRGADPGGRRRTELAGRDRLRAGRRDGPGRRVPRPSLGRRVGVRQDRRPARRPAGDRRRGDPAVARRPPAVGGPRDPRSRRVADRVHAVRDQARLPVRGQPPRQGSDLAPVRLARLRHGHGSGRQVAAVDLLDRLRARRRVARRVRAEGAERSQMSMKAVVMAGGEGTRLRPLTSNQPKPMVPIVGKPCMEHILELLNEHGFDEVIVTLAFLPQAIRGYFGTGESLGMAIEYSVEETPLGTAGSVRLASDRLDETFLVISGDALCDFDLSALVEFHKQKGAAVTIGLKSVENPLEFGIVVTDEDARIERFLEKPSWGQVFSDTINTGIYVIEPEVMRNVPNDRPYDFSKELFPLLLEMGRPIYGYVCDGYWQDIGNLDQYRQANFDALDENVRLKVPGIKLRGDVWIGEGVEIDDVEGVEGPAFVGDYCRVAPDASVAPYTVLATGVTLRERARVSRSIIDSGTYVGRSAMIEGAILGRNCDVRAHARVHEGVAIGDQVRLGDQSVVYPGVRIYPYKEVEYGAQLHESLIWESRASTRLFGKDGVNGLVNVDLTPETAVRLGAALGTALTRGAHVVASRESAAAYRMIKRAMISGLTSAGINVADLRALPTAVGKHLLNTQNYEIAFHVGASTTDPEVLQIRLFERPGTALSVATQKEVEKHFTRQELRRVPYSEVGTISYPARARESYADDLLGGLDADAIRGRGFRIVVDYGYSAASFVLPLLLGPLGVEAVTAHAFESDTAAGTTRLHETIGQAKRLVNAVGADLGAVFDRSAERLYLIDERGR